MKLRPAISKDQDLIINLIGSVYEEYGDRIFLEGADKDLTDVNSFYREKGGEFIVLVCNGEISGTHALFPNQENKEVVNFRRLYLKPEFRGRQYGEELMKWAIDWTIKHGFKKVELWSDVRFKRAHNFYKRYGFKKGKHPRKMFDGAMPYEEFFFHLDLK